MTAPPRSQTVAAVVVSFNTCDSLRRCIEALRRSKLPAGTTLQVIVVDNSSTDGSADVAESADVAILNTVNVGFGRAVNQGLEATQADFYLVLNPDVTCGELAVSRLLACMQDGKGIGAVGASPRSADGSRAVRGYYRRVPTLMQVLLFETSLRKFARRSDVLVCRWLEQCSLADRQDVEQVPGGFFLVSAAVVAIVGGFDEDFFIWYEDVDWSVRARRAGFRLIYCDEAEVTHVGGESFREWPDSYARLVHSNSLRTYFRKHGPIRARFVTLLLVADAIVRFVLRRDRSELSFAAQLVTGGLHA